MISFSCRLPTVIWNLLKFSMQHYERILGLAAISNDQRSPPYIPMKIKEKFSMSPNLKGGQHMLTMIL